MADKFDNSHLQDEGKGDSMSDFDSDVTYFSDIEESNNPNNCKKADIKFSKETTAKDGRLKQEGFISPCYSLSKSETLQGYKIEIGKEGNKENTTLDKELEEVINNKFKKAHNFLNIYNKWKLGMTPLLDRSEAELILNDIRQEKVVCNIFIEKYKDSSDQDFAKSKIKETKIMLNIPPKPTEKDDEKKEIRYESA